MAVKRKGGDKAGTGGSGRPRYKGVKKAKSSPFPKPPRPPSPAAPAPYDDAMAEEATDGVLPPLIDEDD